MLNKKAVVITGLTLIILLISFSSVIGATQRFTKINVFPRDLDGTIVRDGANGWIKLNYGRYGYQIESRALELRRYTFYRLVYTEADPSSGEGAEIYCIDERKANNIGNLKIKTSEFRPVLNEMNFWIVLSEDADCIDHKMIAWNPVNYLFSE
ncbi:MAG: hypothetical protein WC979_08185 [Candidatus Pacearchaeota archaeon]